MFNVFKAFAESPHWESGVFFINYDEWGGFFDHVSPPVLPDDRESDADLNNFGQAGFRVPALMASPYARPGFADHRLYDHTSILRFIEWRFLGAPSEGPGSDSDGWFLTRRDRNALNIGASLLPANPDPEVHVEDVPQPPVASPPTEEPLEGLPAAADEMHAFEHANQQGFFERMGYPVDLRPLPVR